MTSTLPVINLTPPSLDDHCVAQRITCIRPKRAKMLKLEGQVIDGKLIMHNYGAGGFGWTLLFGLVNESIRQFKAMIAANPAFAHRPIRVIGAGCMGLATAIKLHQEGYQVAITAEQIKSITSYNAAGILAPSKMNNRFPAQDAALMMRLTIEAYSEYAAIAGASHPYLTGGATYMPLYTYPIGDSNDFSLDHYVQHGLMPQPDNVMIDFGNGKSYPVTQYQALFINATDMMQQFHALRQTAQIGITHKKIYSFSEIEEEIIFNCSGLGATALNHDTTMVPVQGHLLALHNQPPLQALQYVIHAKVQTQGRNKFPRMEYVYFVPKGNGMLGTSYISYQAGLDTNAHEFDRILQRARSFFG